MNASILFSLFKSPKTAFLKRSAISRDVRITLHRIKALDNTSAVDGPSLLRLIPTEAERRRCEAGVQQTIENGLRSCVYVCMYVCFSRISHDPEPLDNPKWCHVVAL